MHPALSRRKWLGAGAVLCCVIAAAIAASAWSSRRQTERIASTITGGDPARASEIMRHYGCGGCHTIPGIPGADGQVGPPLSGLIHRVYIGGVANNSPDHLIQWIVDPQKFSPGSAMPATGISNAEARDVAAYLYEH
ncbi:MAG TPA: c-type cytochrome [Bradyrhizobium sp.]|nr:c-type cytochrome [Bradyrhizobium sp.]